MWKEEISGKLEGDSKVENTELEGQISVGILLSNVFLSPLLMSHTVETTPCVCVEKELITVSSTGKL